MRTSAELREGFLSFFESKGHKRHPSGSLVPPDWDRSTLLNSAGMQPLMPYFLGRETPPAPLLTTAQKVFRTPDIDEVGLDTFHLTFFEMLGNFSFGAVLQGGRDRLRLGVRLRSHEGRPRQVLGHGLRRRSGARARRGRGGGAPLGGEGPAPGAHRPARPLAQLLVGRRPGPLRAGHRALLRPRRGDRLRPPDLRAGLRVRTLPRVLEPRLHGVRAARGRLGHAASEAERRHRHGPRAGRDDPAGGDRDLRHRRLPGDHELDRRGERRRVRRLGGRDEGAPDPRRPRPRDDVPRRRRCHAVERGPRLRAAPHHPPGRAAGPNDRAFRTSGGSPTSSSTRWATGTRSSSRTAP